MASTKTMDVDGGGDWDALVQQSEELAAGVRRGGGGRTSETKTAGARWGRGLPPPPLTHTLPSPPPPSPPQDAHGFPRVERDLRYWSSRRSTAEVVDPVGHPETVRFGCTVELQNAAGERIRVKIVGEDESDPAQGRISYVSPLAAAMIGAAVGDEVEFRGGMAVIAMIE